MAQRILLRTLGLCAIVAIALVLPFAVAEPRMSPPLFVVGLFVAVPTLIAIQRGWTKYLWLRRLEDLRKRAEAAPSDAELQYELGVLATLQNETDEARRAYERTREIVPGHSGATVGLGHLLVREEKWDEALATFQSAADADPKCFPALYAIGGVHRSREQYARALLAFEKALEIEPDDAFTLGEIARCHLELGDVSRAAEYGRRAEEAGLVDRELNRSLREALTDE